VTGTICAGPGSMTRSRPGISAGTYARPSCMSRHPPTIRRPLRSTPVPRELRAPSRYARGHAQGGSARRFRRGLITKRNEGPSTSDERIAEYAPADSVSSRSSLASRSPSSVRAGMFACQGRLGGGKPAWVGEGSSEKGLYRVDEVVAGWWPRAMRRRDQGVKLYRPRVSVATNRVPWAKTGWLNTRLPPTGRVLRMAPVAALSR
jgi:hypothetical protein